MLIATKHKRVLLRPLNPSMITTVIPTASVVEYQGHKIVAVPHRIDEVRVLNNMGFKVPSPISFYHEWNAPFAAFEAQKITAGMLTLNPRAYVLNELGTGKTQAMLWAMSYLMKVGLIRKAVITCTLSTMERAWGDELFSSFPHLRVAQVHGTREKRMRLLADEDFDVYIINHHGLKIDGVVEALQDRTDIDLLIIDELAVFRNSKSGLYKALDQLVNGTKRRGKLVRPGKVWAWGATAKPTPNEPTDAYAQCRLLTPATVPAYFKQFREMTMVQPGPYKWFPKADSAKTVAAAMQPSVRFRRDQCYDMKEPVYEYRHAEMSPEQKKVYNELRKELVAEYESGQIVAVNEAVKIGKLVQVASGVVYGKDGVEIQLPCPDRLEVLHEISEEASAKLIVFAPYVCTLKMIVEDRIRRGKRVGLVYGEISKSARDKIFYEFQKGELDELVAQPAAMAHGLTLTAADTIAWFAPLDNNEIVEQADGRITRPSQNLTPTVAMIEGSPAERAIYRRNRNKQDFQNVVLEILQSTA